MAVRTASGGAPELDVRPDWLVPTKLFPPPPRARLVARPHLLERLNEAMRQPLTLIAAAAGSGKTSLLAEWRTTSTGASMGLAWLSLDPSDNDPVRFWTYLLAALGTIPPGRHGATALALLCSPHPPALEGILAVLIRDLATLQVDVALVLDDYHLIEEERIHRGVAYLLEHAPQRLHLILASRIDPPLPLARLRARNQIVEIRAHDLRFTSEEAAAFFSDVMRLALPDQVIVELARQTEGWIAGLQLHALALQGRDTLEQPAISFTGGHRYLVDYMVEEVLERQSPHVQDFLLQTAILDRLCGSLCDALTERNDGLALLEQLERANLFLIPLDGERRWYRYHHLFADALRQRLSRTRPELIAGLHRRAAAWYADNGAPADAIRHAILAGDLQRAADLVEAAAGGLIRRGEVATLEGWLDALPPEVIATRPRLSLARGRALLLRGRSDAAESRALDAERAVREQPEPAEARPGRTTRESLLGEAAAVRAYAALARQEYPRAVELSRRALAWVPATDPSTRGLVALNLGTALRLTGATAAAVEALTLAAASAQAAGDALLALYAMTNLAELNEAQGQLRAAAATHERALRLWRGTAGRHVPVAGLAFVGIGKVLREQNELRRASRHLDEGIQLGRQGGIEGIVVDGLITLALVRQAEGNPTEAFTLLHGAAEIVEQWNDDTSLRVAAFEARLGLAEGRVDLAARWARQCTPAIRDDTSGRFQIEQTTLARTSIALARSGSGPADLERAMGLLRRLLLAAEADGRTGSTIELLALLALALGTRGDTQAANAALVRALNLAEPEGYARIFLDEGTPMIRQLETIATGGGSGGLATASRYADTLLAMVAPRPPDAAGPAAGGRQVLAEPLGQREIDVLRLMAAGASNGDIARELVIGSATVKTHVNRIFRKLDARSRTQAVARARALGLLAP